MNAPFLPGCASRISRFFTETQAIGLIHSLSGIMSSSSSSSVLVLKDNVFIAYFLSTDHVHRHLSLYIEMFVPHILSQYYSVTIYQFQHQIHRYISLLWRDGFFVHLSNDGLVQNTLAAWYDVARWIHAHCLELVCSVTQLFVRICEPHKRLLLSSSSSLWSGICLLGPCPLSGFGLFWLTQGMVRTREPHKRFQLSISTWFGHLIPFVLVGRLV